MDIENTNQNILIVDDSTTDITVLRNALKSVCRIRFAKSGEQALEMVMSEPPHLIILDIILPGIDGYEVCKRLKEESATRDIPIIFITVKNRNRDEAKGLELGAVDYITKPFFLPIVKARVKTQLELKKHRDMLERLSSLDGLTGIPNRRRFNEYINQEWRNAMRESKSLSMVMIDIDYFKAYNDEYGHMVGDECLKQVAQALTSTLKRPRDFIARYGGEEFVVVLPNTDEEGAYLIAEKMRKKIEDIKITHGCSTISNIVTVSLGVASVDFPLELKGDPKPDALINTADKALYMAKNEGRNQIKFMQVLKVRNETIY